MNNKQTERQIFALAGAFQAIYLINEIAKKGFKQNNKNKIILKSLWVFEPYTTFEVYGNNKKALKDGYQTIIDILSGNAINSNANSYFLDILKRADDVLSDNIISGALGEEMEAIEINDEYDDILISFKVLEEISQIQIKLSKKYPKPIKIHGDKIHLSNEYNINLVRALLFASMRGALLWRQLGGRKLHFLFKRGAIIDIAKQNI